MKITYVNNRLRDALDAAPPMMAATAVKQAEALLTEIEQECVTRLDALLAAFPTGLSGEADGMAAQIRTVYDTARRIIGVATVAKVPEIDVAARSLCDVADGLLVRSKHDWEPLRVHIATMHLLRRSDVPVPAKGQLLVALETVRGRFAASPPPALAAPAAAPSA